MAALTADDIVDLVAGTLRDLGPNKFSQIAQDLQHYEVMGKWLKKDKIVFDDGRGIQRNLMSRLSNQAAHVGLTDTDSADIPDLMDQLNIPWRHAQTKWAFIYQTDILMNRGKSLIFNVIKPRRADAMISLAKELEAKAWSIPAVDNKTEPYGVPYWIVYNATTGFTGGYPGSHTTIAGVDLTDSPNFKNYSANYAAVTKADLIKKMRTGHRKLGWMSPVTIEDYRGSQGQKLRIYTDEATVTKFEDLGEAQNENLGRDLASMQAGGRSGDVKEMDGQITFRKIPIVWIPQLDDTAVYTAATSPVYMIDHSTFYPVCLKGDYLREQKPEKAPNQHNVFRVFVDLSYNYLCVDRRRNAIFATA